MLQLPCRQSSRSSPLQRGLQPLRLATLVGLCGSPLRLSHDVAGRLNKTRSCQHLAVEVRWVEWMPPQGFVHTAQLPHGERVATKGRRQCGVFDAVPGSFDTCAQDRRVIERERGPIERCNVDPGGID